MFLILHMVLYLFRHTPLLFLKCESEFVLKYKIWPFISNCQLKNLNSYRYQKQSADGQAQLDVGGEASNNLCTKCAAKFWT